MKSSNKKTTSKDKGITIHAAAASTGNTLLAWMAEAGKKIVSGVKVVASVGARVQKLFDDGIKLEPEAKTLIVQLVKDAEGVAAPVSLAIATKGLSWTSDAAAVAAVEAMVKNFTTLLPQAKQLVDTLEGDVKQAF